MAFVLLAATGTKGKFKILLLVLRSFFITCALYWINSLLHKQQAIHLWQLGEYRVGVISTAPNLYSYWIRYLQRILRMSGGSPVERYSRMTQQKCMHDTLVSYQWCSYHLLRLLRAADQKKRIARARKLLKFTRTNDKSPSICRALRKQSCNEFKCSNYFKVLVPYLFETSDVECLKS